MTKDYYLFVNRTDQHTSWRLREVDPPHTVFKATKVELLFMQRALSYQEGAHCMLRVSGKLTQHADGSLTLDGSLTPAN